MTVFEPKHSLEGCYDGTYAIPLSQTATFNIKCLKWDLKDSPYVWTKYIFKPKIKQKNNLLGVSLGHLSIFLIDAVNSLVKNASIAQFKFVERRPRDNKIL